MRVLVLTTDAFGGRGGIALYNRDLVRAIAALPEVSEVIVVARNPALDPEPVPDKVRIEAGAAGGKLRFVRSALSASMRGADLLVCGHVNLLPLAALLNVRLRARLVLMAYGIDVWRRPPRATVLALRAVDAVWSISAVTRERMNAWARLPDARYVLLPNAIHLEQYGIGAPRADLQARLGLAGRRVVMTLGRLSSSERYKGVDEVLDVLPELARSCPDVCYLVAGDGDDRPRLEARARELGLQDRVVFAGFVDESEKADYFRLADVFAMPSSGEGFGFVFLEALACGIPVVASRVDGSREAVLDGELGEVVDPADRDSVRSAIVRALQKPRAIPPGLEHFSWPRFRQRVAAAVDSLRPSNRQAA